MFNLKTLSAILAAICVTTTSLSQDPASHVDPFIGTVKMGHTFPGACVPHGIVQLSPDTDTIPQNIGGVYQGNVYRYCAGYQHDDPTIVGFSHTHFSGTGHSDLGDILVMPTTGKRQLNPGTADDPLSGYRSAKSRDFPEKASPGYYEVMLADHGIRAELTATERTGVHRYTYPENEIQRIVIDLEHGIYNYDGKTLWAGIRVECDTLITGYRITNGWARENYTYFAASFSRPIAHYGYEDRHRPLYTGFWRKFNQSEDFPEMSGRAIVSWFEFDPHDGDRLEIKIALSAVSTDGALANLRAETSGKNFDRIRAEAREKWNRELGRFEIEGSADEKTMFYTSLYHTMINPSIYMDVDGKYRGIDHNIHTTDGFVNYTVFSMWDTFRALHPLFNIINRGRNSDMMRSMLAHRRQSVHGALPVWSHMGNENWCMIGYHSVPALADALATGQPIDRTEAMEAMKSSANVSYYDGIEEYRTLGYVPAERSGSGASITLEYAYDDWTIYKTALATGDESAVDTYRKRAQNWKNIFDPATGFARPRMSNGEWKAPFDMLDTHGQGFIEGNSWNYSFYVPHDVRGMMEVMGGDKKFVERLDKLFTMELPDKYFENTEDITRDGIMGNYVHGNEPSHHIPYLYAWTSQPWKTQERVRDIMNRMYVNSIDGLCGNDDCGQMSAWYIFSAMGFYPVCPGTGEYVLGAPYLPYIRLSLENGNTLEIKAPKVSDRNRYVQTVRLNGQRHDKMYVTHEEIMRGGVLEFDMGPSPNRRRGTADQEEPYSMTL
jgi:predicted alpha-1,2-mannosidase